MDSGSVYVQEEGGKCVISIMWLREFFIIVVSSRENNKVFVIFSILLLRPLRAWIGISLLGILYPKIPKILFDSTVP
jgi:hypothetical protein